MKKLLLIAALLFSGLANALVVAPTQSTDNVYYVSTAAKGGNNSNPCTKTRPCLTVAGAAAKVTKAGSIIHVNTSQGVFTETTQIALAVEVTLECDGKAYNSIRPSSSITLLKLNSSEGAFGNQEVRYCNFDGNSLTGDTALIIGGRSNVLIHDNNFQNWNNYGIKLSAFDDNLAIESAPTLFGVGNKIYNNTFTNSSGQGKGNIGYGGQNGIEIYGNYLDIGRRTTDFLSGYGIKYYKGGFSKNEKIFNNTILKPSPDGTSNGSVIGYFSIELWNGLGGLEIYGNRLQGIVDLVFFQKGDKEYSVDFHHNDTGFDTTVAIVNSNNGITLEGGVSDVIIRNNYAHGMGVTNPFVFFYNGYGQKNAPTYNILVKNNIILNGRTFNMTGRAHSRISNFKFLNNTAANIPSAADYVAQFEKGILTNFQIANNIFYGFTTGGVLFVGNDDSESIYDGFNYENNLTYLTNGLTYQLARPFKNLVERNNITATDPLFKNTVTTVENAGSLTVGKWYTITTVGTSNFPACGASSNTVGVKFAAATVCSGTGTATPLIDLRLKNTYQSPSDGVDSPARFKGLDVGIYEDYVGYTRVTNGDIGALEVPHNNLSSQINKVRP